MAAGGLDRRAVLALATRAAGLLAARPLLAAPLILVAGCGGAGRDPAGVPDPLDAIVTRWADDPWARGSYSYLRRGASPADRVALRAPVGPRLLLAGEATAPDFPATVHGALLSGIRAAEAVLDLAVARVAVIGAGAAGLGAAAVLAEADVHVQVLEARDRIGGRVHTVERWGVPLDLGAAWIHGVDGNPLTDLAEQAGAALHPFDYDDTDVHDPHGGDVDAYESVAAIDLEYGADAADLAPAATEEGEELGGGDALLPGGYLPLLEALDVDDLVRTGWPVEVVRHDAAGVDVRGPQGAVVADAAILTVPLGLLQAGVPTLDPPLPPATAAAVGRLGMGLLDKCILRFAEPFWDPDVGAIGIVPAPTAPGEWAEFVNLLPVVGEPVLVGFNGGSAARRVAAQDDDAVVAAAIAALRAAYG